MGVISGIRSILNGGTRSASISSTGRRDSARHDIPELFGWHPPLGFSGSDLYGEWSTTTGRARDLDQNNGWINGGLDRRVESVIGGQIRLSAQPVHELLNRDYDWRMGWTGDVQSRFRVWGSDIERRCDARQNLSFGALAKLAYLTYSRDGEAAAEIARRQLVAAQDVAHAALDGGLVADVAAVQADAARALGRDSVSTRNTHGLLTKPA